jgi:midasin (ATPase involved in ribosome maturation)
MAHETSDSAMDFSVIENPWHLFYAISPYLRRGLLHSEAPGTGKTSAGIALAEARNADLVVITLTDAHTATDLLGHWVNSKANSTTWHYGPVAKALKSGRPVVIVFNETSNAGPDAIQILYALLEEGKAATFTLPSNEVLTIGEHVTILCTQNPDPKETLPRAVLNRFEMVLDIGEHISPAILDALPVSLRSIVKDGRMAAREAFTLLRLVGDGCQPFVAVQAVLGIERTRDYGDALAIALATGNAFTLAPRQDDESDEDDSDEDDE